MTQVFYNENNDHAADWLDELRRAGQIADGVVDRRSILNVGARDVVGFKQAHFFGGIGGWAYALRLAGWPAEEEIWTGSCPCQPFSITGARQGFDDGRHLWPEWFRLIRECRPRTVIGEQVASRDGLEWLDAVCADLEGAGYAVGATDLCAASIGAPHIRQRLWFVAVADSGRLGSVTGHPGDAEKSKRRRANADRRRSMGNADGDRVGQHARELPGHEGEHGERSAHGGDPSVSSGADGGLADSDSDSDSDRSQRVLAAGSAQRSTIIGSAHSDFWRDVEWVRCLDGKARPIKPGLSPVAHGLPDRVGRLCGYGNAITPQAATVFVRAVMDILGIEGESK